MIFTDTHIKKLQNVMNLFKQYDKERTRTELEKVLAKDEEKFSNTYQEINLKRSDKINPLTTCAHGSNASVMLSAIMFSGGQLLPLNEIKKNRVLDIHNFRSVGNQNFLYTVHLRNAQDFHNARENKVKDEDRDEKYKNSILKDDEISFGAPIHYSQGNVKSNFSKDVFLERIAKRCEGNENIYTAMSNALDDDVLKFFEELSRIPVIALGDGVGQFEGDLNGNSRYTITWNQPRETLFERFNISIIAVKKEHRELIEPLTKINPDLNIVVIDQEELLEFTKEYNSQFYDNSVANGRLYNTKCDNTISKSFMEALVEHFKLPLTFSERVEPVTLTKRSIYNLKSRSHNRLLEQGVEGRLDKVSYCVKGLKQKQEFYNEAQVKEAIKKREKINDCDPIIYALLDGIMLDEQSPILYAMKNGIKIEDKDPALWAQENKYKIEGNIYPIDYAMNNGIKIEDKDPILWAQENGHKIEKIDPIAWALNGTRRHADRYVFEARKIEGIDATKWADNAITNGTKIEGIDAKEWISNAVEEAIKIKVQESGERRYRDLISYAMKKDITIEGIDAKYWMDYANRPFEIEKKDLNAAKKWIQDRKEASQPAQEAEQSQPAAAEVSSPNIDVPTSEENPKLEEDPLEDVVSLGGTNEETETQQTITKNVEEPQIPPHEPAAPLENHREKDTEKKKVQFYEQEQDPKTNSQKPESNRKYHVIGGAVIGLAIGLAVAYFAGAAALTPVLVAVTVFIAAAIVGAALAAEIGYAVSKCFDNPTIATHQQQGVQPS